MKSLTPAERREALKSFVDQPDGGLFVADRSTLQHWADCPWQAKAIADGRCRTVGIAAEAGSAVHAAFSAVTIEWIESNGAMSPVDLRQDVEHHLRNSRPDIQPEALAAAMPSLWQWAKLISSIHPGNILGFDGGEELDPPRSGQLAYDIVDLGVRITGELDLITSTESIEVLDVYDYKTGWKTHDVGDVASSFQFQFYAVLALETYPKVECVRFRVFDTRSNRIIYAVNFLRSRLHDYMVRIRSAIDSMRTHQDNPPTWPTLEKCSICPAAALCPVADEPLADLAADPPGFVKRMVAVGARLDAMQALAAKHVDATGKDIECGTIRFGRGKPKANRKPTAELYEISNPKE
jgi:hypothetical protein